MPSFENWMSYRHEDERKARPEDWVTCPHQEYHNGTRDCPFCYTGYVKKAVLPSKR